VALDIGAASQAADRVVPIAAVACLVQCADMVAAVDIVDIVCIVVAIGPIAEAASLVVTAVEDSSVAGIVAVADNIVGVASLVDRLVVVAWKSPFSCKTHYLIPIHPCMGILLSGDCYFLRCCTWCW
jgi:hypothetical protein